MLNVRSAVGHGEVSGAHNGVALITEQQEPQQYEEQDTNSIGQIHLQLMLASIRRTLTIPMQDHLITELDNRFTEAAAGIVGELAQILPSEFCSAYNPSHFKEVLQLYMDDLPQAKALHM